MEADLFFPIALYARKLGKLSSDHRTGKGQFSFQSQRKAMPKNAQTTTRKSNQSILMEISPGCSLEGLMLKVKLQYFGHLM